MMVFCSSGSLCCGQNGVDKSKVVEHILISRLVLDVIGFKMIGKAPVQSNLGLNI